ncbi:hypothetical protein GpartN1_g296.t1 [Galdieria partita]|uniref:Uncharacterized protein n=1 Tax=Galdieria partita TaxID=83374 RepID=A0A9C7PQA6_9RHOD|nr:hypothetical protein GpartN1_g296.t1 [Galdieria partita]
MISSTMDDTGSYKLEELEFYLYCIFYKELESMKEGALRQLESRGWFEEQCRQQEDSLWDASKDSLRKLIDSSADQFPQDIKESLFAEVLGLFRNLSKEFRKWKLEEQPI